MSSSAAKILGQLKPSAATLSDLYTVGGGLQAQASIFVCQQNTTSSSLIRIALRGGGAGINAMHYIAYDYILDPNGIANFTSICLGAGDVISVYSLNGDCSFTACGLEITP